MEPLLEAFSFLTARCRILVDNCLPSRDHTHFNYELQYGTPYQTSFNLELPHVQFTVLLAF